MNSEEMLLGFHMTKRTKANALLSLIKSSLTAFNLPFLELGTRLGYDGTSKKSAEITVTGQSCNRKHNGAISV